MKWTGDYFGYPRCCQAEFLKNLKDRTNPNMMRAAAGQCTGFIPCTSHAYDVLCGHIALTSLIGHRVCSAPFPNGGGDKAFYDFCRNCKDEP